VTEYLWETADLLTDVLLICPSTWALPLLQEFPRQSVH